MSELVTMVEEQGRRIEQLVGMVDHLTRLVLKGKVDDTWIDEETAAEMLGYKKPRTLREKVIGKVIPIDYRHTNGRNFQYSRKQLMNYKRDTTVEV